MPSESSSSICSTISSKDSWLAIPFSVRITFFNLASCFTDSLFTNPFFSINWIRFVTVDLPTANLCSISFWKISCSRFSYRYRMIQPCIIVTSSTPDFLTCADRFLDSFRSVQWISGPIFLSSSFTLPSFLYLSKNVCFRIVRYQIVCFQTYFIIILKNVNTFHKFQKIFSTFFPFCIQKNACYLVFKTI